jgi:sigma-E factor negative regulatory protein RseB
MNRLRMLLVLGCVGALVAGSPVLACMAPDPAEPVTTPARSVSALGLLERAATVSRTTAWRGTQSVVSTRGDLPRYQLLTVEHAPGAGSTVVGMADSQRGVAPDLLDEQLFQVLTRHYDLAVVGATLCGGRRTVLVEARRPGRTGPAAIAGRFWIDRETAMVWRRDVLDDDGSVVLSTAFSSLGFTRVPAPAKPSPMASPAARLGDHELQDLIEDGWPVVDHLPSGLDLFEAQRHPDGVLQLSYSDGLSTLSLFVQQGSLPSDTRGSLREVGGALVHVTSTAPEQLVWAGAGRTWTLVSDAPDTAIQQAVLVLPHADPPTPREGVVSRTWRGMSRVGAWLNPFD